MKLNIIKSLLVGGCALSLVACGDDYLDRVPKSNYVEDNFYTSDAALQAATAPLYGPAWFAYNMRASMQIGTARANDFYNPWFGQQFLEFTATALDSDLANTWKGFYATVTMTNALIDAVNTKTYGDVTESGKNMALGEAYIMRGMAYFYMVRTWNNVILFENNLDVVQQPLQPLSSGYDVLTFVIRDFKRAAELLPESAQKGRATRWSALALLAKAYLARSGWNGGTRDQADLDKAKEAALEVCENSGLNLLEVYDELFQLKHENNEECLLAMQWPEQGGWGACNTLLADIAFSSKVTGGVNVWGGGSASIDMLKLYEPADSIRLHSTFFIHGEHYPEIDKANGGYTHEDYNAPIKKYIIGGSADNDGVYIASMDYPMNTYMIRLADTYLTLAEACLGNNESISDGPGLIYFNRVRRRAGMPQLHKITFEDIVKERRIEFCMEYCNWYDMVSWYRWKPDYMLDYFNNQLRGSWADQYVKEKDGYIHFYIDSDYDGVMEETTVGNLQRTANIIITHNNIFLPYPENDVIQNPLLNEDPVPYDFNED